MFDGKDIVCPNCYFCCSSDQMMSCDVDQEEYKATFSGVFSCPSCSHSVSFLGWADFHQGQDYKYFDNFIMDLGQQTTAENKFLTLEQYCSEHREIAEIALLNQDKKFDINLLDGTEKPYCIYGSVSIDRKIHYSRLYSVPSWNLLIKLGLHNLIEFSDAEKLKKTLPEFKKKVFLNTLQGISKKYSLKIPDNWVAYLSE